ncbi:MAG: ATP-binding protein [Stagnimonas sp.]|nr:ATP-binding protein [Stagnimonas sp.]
MTTTEQLRHWIGEPEGERLEFKTAANRFDFEKLLDYCVALANEGGGKIILGVSDRRPRQLIGTSAFDEPGRTEAGIYQRLHHRVQIEETSLEGHRLLIAHVPPRLPGTAWQHNGRYLRRAGDDLIAIPDIDLKTMFAEAGPDYSAEPCEATLSDLAPKALQEFRRRWARKVGNLKILEWSDEKLLADAELLVGTQLNFAALVLLGTRTALGRYLAQSEVIFEYRSSEASGPAQDRIEFREGFLLCHDALWQRINLRNDRQSYQDGLFRYDIPTFDEAMVREALLNAVAHRDYRLSGSVFLRQFSRRLEVISPGGLPPGITPQNIIDQQNPRNRRLAEALGKCGLIERSGQGANLMVETAIRQSKPMPDYAGSAAHEVRLALHGAVQNPAFIRFVERIGEDQLRSFSTHDFITLDALAREQTLNAQHKACLPRLIETGLVESAGRGRGIRYWLSRDLYLAAGTVGTYTRRRGLDHETNKALLEKHLKDCGRKGAPISEFMQVLPSHSRSHIRRLLDELAAEQRAHKAGARRAGRWFVGTHESNGAAPMNQ